MKIKTILLVATVFAICTSNSALHAANTYPVVWDGTFAHYWEGEEEEGSYISEMVLASSFGDGMPMPALSVNFLTSKEFRITLSAPEGYLINFLPPPTPLGADGEPESYFNIQLDASTGSSAGEFFSGTLAGYSFAGAQGVEPSLYNDRFDFASASSFPSVAPSFSIFAGFDILGGFSFTSLTLDFTAPANMEIAGDFSNPDGSITAVWEGDFDYDAGYGLAPAEPAPWVQLTAVPEPSTYALLSLAAAGLGAHVLRRRRK